MKTIWAAAGVAIALSVTWGAPAIFAQSGAHWIASWATAQELAPTVPDVPQVPPTVRRPDFSRNGAAARPVPPTDIHDQTVRMTVKIGVGGPRFRVELSNAFGKKPVTVGTAHAALKGEGNSISAGTDQRLTFSGNPEVRIFPGSVVISDPVDFRLPDSANVVVSLYIRSSEGLPTLHALGLHTTYITEGDKTTSVEMPSSSRTTTSYLWLSGVDVLAPADRFTIVALGDSITDGFKTTVDTNRAWPTLLQDRLLTSTGSPKASVLNQGISGNQVLRDGAGVSALARFDRDVLSHPGVRWVILLEGINDINIHGQIEGDDALRASDLIAGYQQLIAKAHMHNIKVMGATLTPEEGVWLAGPVGESTRQTVNDWIRSPGHFDAVVDFDAVLRDPDNKAKLRADLDPGDHIHPNDDGNALMSKQFSLMEFRP